MAPTVESTSKVLRKEKNEKKQSFINGDFAESSTEEDFTEKAGQSTVLRLPSLGSKRIGLIGLGQCNLTAAYKSLREAVAAAAKAVQASDVAVTLASPEGLSADSKLTNASAIASRTVLEVYKYNRFKSESYCNLVCLDSQHMSNLVG